MTQTPPDHLMRQSLTRDYPRIVRGERHYLIDDRGHRIIDGASGGVGPCNVGHGVAEIVDAMAEQARTLALAHISMYENEPQVALANMLCEELAPPGFTKAYFTSTGTEANELAIKMARLYHLCRGNESKYHIISVWGGYHGSSIAATSYSGRSNRRDDLHPYFFPTTKLEPPYCYHCPYAKTYPDCGLHCAHALEQAIRRLGPQHVSCFIPEPIGHTLGCVSPPPGYFPAVREICDRYDVVLIADEVITAFGRCGEYFAMPTIHDTTPDVIALGKGISAGYAPRAATLVDEKLWAVFAEAERALPGFTYGGNPLSCAVGLAAQNYIQQHNLVARSRQLGSYMYEQAHTELAELPIVGDIRGGKGLYMGIEYVQDKTTREPFPADMNLAGTIGDMAFDNGLATCPIGGGVDGILGDVNLIKPPFTIPQEDIDRIIRIMKATILQAHETVVGG